MNWEAWYTLAVIAGILGLLIAERFPPSFVMLGGSVALLVAGIVTPSQALSGFSNPAPVTVAALFVLARAVEKTGALTPVVQSTLGGSGSVRGALVRLVGATGAASAFLNNTPIVAMLMPQVNHWAEAKGRSPSTYLMPLSFAALLGGTITLIGTSTNLVVSGLMEQAGYPPLRFFEIAGLGAPLAVAASALIVLLAPLLIPQRRSPHREAEEAGRKFVVEVEVSLGGAVDGRTVEEAGLRNLRGVYLAAVDRHGDLITPVGPETRLRGGDHLRFVGKATDVVDLHARSGLTVTTDEAASHPEVSYVEAVLGASSPLVGRTLKEFGFRDRYQAVVVAIHRAGSLVEAKLGEVRLRVGDTLLLLADPGFHGRWRDQGEFLLVAPVDSRPMPRTGRSWLVIVVGLGLVGSVALELIPILHASLLAAVLLVTSGVLTAREARAAVDLDVVILIAAAFGVAAAAGESGLATRVAGLITETFAVFGSTGVLAGITITTMILTAVVSNNAAALLMFPIAVEAAAAARLDPRGLFIAIAVAASIDFLTPIGYQTNTMVWGPGGYRFSDYARLGLPLTITAVIATLTVVPRIWPL